MPDTAVVAALAIVFASTFARAAIGFGDALIAMPLLAMVFGVRTATPLVALVSVAISVAMLARIWREVDLRAAWRLVLSTMVGIPIGLYLLKAAPEGVVKSILGAVLVVYGVTNLVWTRFPTLKSEGSSWAFGLVAGVLGGAYNTNGPPVVIYGTLRQWPPARFRATLQGYFLPTGIAVAVGHGLAGLWTKEVLTLYLYSAPAMLFAMLLGGALHRRVNARRFNQAVSLFLVLMGILLFF